MIRETISGAVTEYSKFYVPEGTRPRSSRRGKSSPRKQDQNDRDAAKRLARILNCNFRAGDALVTLTYAAETERAEGEKRVKNFLRRLKRQAEKVGLAFRWVLVNLAISAVVLLAVNLLERGQRQTKKGVRGWR